jgi:hypothetical protein
VIGMKTSLLFTAPLLAGALVAGVAAPAFADGASTPSPTHAPATLADLQKKGAEATAKRSAALTTAIAKVTAAKDITDAHRSTVLTTLKADLAAMTSLGAKIAADTDAATAKADVRDIYTEYRVFAVALPQARIAAGADHLTVTVIPRLTAASQKLTTRAAGNADAQAKLADLTAQLGTLGSDADGLADKALAVTPAAYDADHTAMSGVRSTATSARAAAKQARADIAAIRVDLGTK